MLHEVTPKTMRLLMALLLLLGPGVILANPGDPATLSATAPRLDDEEKYSAHMPTHLHCDACRAVVYQMSQHLTKAEARFQVPDSRERPELRESVYTDVLDQSCTQSWKDYGVQEVNQVKRLMGPGLSKEPGPRISVMVTGGPWPTRLTTTCLHYLGEIGEDQIYEAHQQGRGALEALLCGGTRGACSEEAQVPRIEL